MMLFNKYELEIYLNDQINIFFKEYSQLGEQYYQMSDKELDEMNMSLKGFLDYFTNGLIQSGVVVECKLPNNERDKDMSKAIQCPTCKNFFCKIHFMDKCPLCGDIQLPKFPWK